MDRGLAKHFLRKVFLEDWGLKLIALVITLGLWLGVTGLSSPSTRRMNVPLSLSISSDAQVTNPAQQELDIEIIGDKRKVDQLTRGTLTAFLDLTDMKPGNWVVSLSPDNVFVDLPQGIKLVDVAPSRIAINIETVAEKEVEVRAETSGDPSEGYEVYAASPLPPRIRVRGAASVVGALEYLKTDTIDITDRKEDFTARQIAVSSPNPQVAVLNTVVDVLFRIGERRVERSFDIAVEGAEDERVSFKLFAPRTPLLKAKREDIKVEVYLDGNGVLVPRLILPADLENVSEIRDLKLK